MLSLFASAQSMSQDDQRESGICHCRVAYCGTFAAPSLVKPLCNAIVLMGIVASAATALAETKSPLRDAVALWQMKDAQGSGKTASTLVLEPYWPAPYAGQAPPQATPPMASPPASPVSPPGVAGVTVPDSREQESRKADAVTKDSGKAPDTVKPDEDSTGGDRPDREQS